MGISLAQLLAPPSKEQVRAQLLQAIQGLGYIEHTLGVSPGVVSWPAALSTSGQPTGAFDCVVKVATAGRLGVVRMAVSLDGGATFAASVLVSPDVVGGTVGHLALTGTGVTLEFADYGPATDTTISFILGDAFAFALAVPTLPVTAWQPGSTPLTLVEVFAEAQADLRAAVLATVQGGLVPYSYGAWLDLVAQGVYGLQRVPAQVATHRFAVTDTASAGPFSVSPGALSAGTAGGLRYISTNIAPLTLAKGGTLTLTLSAESPGAEYNVGLGSIAILYTALPGATCANVDTGNGSSIIQAGQDQESDASLAERCQARWPTLGLAANGDQYDLLAKTASTQVTRTATTPSDTVAGQVDLVLAGAAGAVSGPVVTAVTGYLASRLPLATTVNVVSATNRVAAVAGTVYVRRGLAASARAQAQNNLDALYLGATIGGTVYFSAVLDAIQSASGVRNVVLTSPTVDLVLASNEVATAPTLSLTFVEV